jgi:RNA polymerase sigma-70 factor, ECF subfamily
VSDTASYSGAGPADGADTSDEGLVERARHGDEVAFALLVRRYERPLFNYLRRMTRSAADAEDLFQETFVRVHRHLDRFRAGAPFKPWLYRIATNRCKDHLKYMARRRHDSLDAPIGDEGSSGTLRDLVASTGAGPDAEARAGELAERIEEAVARLPLKQRSVFLMARYEGLAYAEIAETLRIPIGTVKSRMHKAVKALMTDLEDVLP